MSLNSNRVVAGFLRLSKDEQDEVIKEINNYINKSSPEKTIFEGAFQKRAGIYLGPTGGGCPCCGK